MKETEQKSRTSITGASEMRQTTREHCQACHNPDCSEEALSIISLKTIDVTFKKTLTTILTQPT